MSPRSQKVRQVEIGEMARHLRKLRGLTLDAAAAELGVSASGLSQAERGIEQMVQLALRSLNEHLGCAAEAGLVKKGCVRAEFQAYGGAQDLLGLVRAPEVARRAGLLRQALLARDVTLMNDGHSAHIDVPGARIEIDLRDMSVSAVRQDKNPQGPFPRLGMPLGRLVGPEPESADYDAAWALAIDRLAAALVAATKKTGLFNPRPIQSALRMAAPAGPTATNPNDAMET